MKEYLSVGTATLRKPVVMLTRIHKESHTKDIIELAEFPTVEAAKAFLTLIEGGVSLANGKMMCGIQK